MTVFRITCACMMIVFGLFVLRRCDYDPIAFITLIVGNIGAYYCGKAAGFLDGIKPFRSKLHEFFNTRSN